MQRAGVIRGSRPLRHSLAGWGAEAKYGGVAQIHAKAAPLQAVARTRLPFRGQPARRSLQACPTKLPGA
jgi:hypothetical protein